jgi:hypothetical protein
VGLDRQLSWREGSGCKHRSVDEVRSADGRVKYGEYCRACHSSWGIGDCAGCLGKGRRLALLSLSGERFCDEGCQEEHARRKQKAAAEARAAYRALLKHHGLPDGCEHRETEDVVSEGGEVIGERCRKCSQALKSRPRGGAR